MKFTKQKIIMLLFLIMFAIVLITTAIKVDNKPAASTLLESNQFSLSLVQADVKLDPMECISDINPEHICEATNAAESSYTDEITSEYETNESNYYIELSDAEINELATLVYLEAGGESFECQKAVASVVINRMTTGNETLKDVIYAKNQFSPARLISVSKPSDSTLDAVKFVIEHGPTIPEYVTYFRAIYYHKWAGQVPYSCIDNTYFSYDVGLKDQIENS